MNLQHQDARTRFRPTDSTLIMDVSIQSVQGRGRIPIVRQTKQAPVKGGDRQSQYKASITVDANGHEVRDIDGMVMIETSFPVTILIGATPMECTGIFALTGSIPSLIIVAAQPTAVSITAVLRNL